MTDLKMGAYFYHWPHGLMFHRFYRKGCRPVGQGSISDVEFEAILRYVGPERILNPREWILRVKAGTLRNADVCITFDDGLRSQFEVALPILDRLGLKAFWFVYSSALNGSVDRNEISSFLATSIFSSFEEFAERFEAHASLVCDTFNSGDFVEFANKLKTNFSFYSDADIKFRYYRNFLLSKDEFKAIIDKMIGEVGLNIAELSSRLWLAEEDIRSLHRFGHVIGLHSWSHPFALAGLSFSEQDAEYKNNYQHLSALTGSSPESMSHPLNSYSEKTLAILHKLKIACGFCSNMSVPEGKKCVNPSNYEFGRMDSTDLLKMIK